MTEYQIRYSDSDGLVRVLSCPSWPDAYDAVRPLDNGTVWQREAGGTWERVWPKWDLF